MDQVTVAGSGVLGSQIAFQCAYKGCDVRIYDIDPGAITTLSQKWRELSTVYRKDLKAEDAALAATVGRLRAGSDLAEAVQGADLVIEAVPESVAVKRRFYEALSVVAPRRRYSQPIRLRFFRACLRNSRIGPNGFLRSTSPVASGETTLPRSCATREPMTRRLTA
jgi:3-hydroxyacyl-CoA dehydrogenase, NAD binding domain